MGWASGSEVLDKIVKGVMPLVPAKDRDIAATVLVEAFEDADCDTIEEVREKHIQRALRRMHPDWDWEE